MNHKPGSVDRNYLPPSVLKNRYRFFLCSLPAFNRRAAGRIHPNAAWLCSWWGLPFRQHCCCRGRLLPCHFTLTWYLLASRKIPGGILSVALSVPPPDRFRG